MAVFTALVMSFVLIGVTAFAVDLGMQRVVRRDMQALADIVAMDLAREINGRTKMQLAQTAGDMSNATSAVRASVARNAGTLGEDLVVDVAWGSYANGVWDPTADPPSAVKVTASSSVDFSFMEGSGGATRTAYASASSTACYRLGSFVASIDSADSTVLGPLNHLLGVNLGLVSYQGLAKADVTLGQLAARPSIGTPEQLLTGTVQYRTLLQAMLDVLTEENKPANHVAIQALGVLINATSSTPSLKLGDVLHVAPSDVAALETDLNILDIIGSARVATGQHFIDIPKLHAGVAGLGNHISGAIQLISAAELACGKPNTPETVAKNSQLKGTLGIDFFNLPSLNLGVATLQTAKGDGTIEVNIGEGTGQLVSPPEVYCGAGTAVDPHAYDVEVSTNLASYRLNMNLTVEGDLKISVLEDLGLADLLDNILGGILGSIFGNPNKKTDLEIKLSLSVGTGGAPGESVAHLKMPPNDKTPVRTGSDVRLHLDSLVPTITSIKVGGASVDNIPLMKPLTDLVINGLVGANAHFLTKTVEPLLENLEGLLIEPVAKMVGLRFGGADVYAAGVKCGSPQLTG